jgi:hypothetical protein
MSDIRAEAEAARRLNEEVRDRAEARMLAEHVPAMLPVESGEPIPWNDFVPEPEEASAWPDSPTVR